MAKSSTYEMRALNPISKKIEALVYKYEDKFESQLQVLEVIASKIGGYSYEEYNEIFEVKALLNMSSIEGRIQEIISMIYSVNIEPSLILSSLAREPINEEQQRKTGAFYTDFRLATFVSNECEEALRQESKVGDISAGTGMLLAAVAVKYKRKFPTVFNKWLRENVYAYDLSDNALRGARIAISALTNDLQSIARMTGKWLNVDSLITEHIPNGFFDIIIGNPPWGKIKLLKHNFVQGSGIHHIYGDEFDEIDSHKFTSEKARLSEYVLALKKRYSTLMKTEPDMYIAFLQKTLFSLKKNGILCMLVPAGLIRSKGTTELREYLIDMSEEIQFTLLDNNAKYFAIDSRFKFLLLNLKTKSSGIKLKEESIYYGECIKDVVIRNNKIVFEIDELRKARPDMTIPEVRNAREKELYFRIYSRGILINELKKSSKWLPTLSREIDMTNHRKFFVKGSELADELIPVIEGRMIQPFHFGAKKYVSGAGRSAIWENALERNGIFPQFKIDKDNIPINSLKLIKKKRAGYCDIAGQTNERAMMSAIIQPNVVCGNKVPTVTFLNDDSDGMIYLWVAITNSFVYDWLLRRIVSTTANYFLLLSIPMPNIPLESQVANLIIEKCKILSKLDLSCINAFEKHAILRAEVDIHVAKAYGLNIDDVKLVLEDFPLLDRKQPPILGEKRSTVTKDYLLSVAEKEFLENDFYQRRYKKAQERGAIPYIPTEMVDTVLRREKNGT